MTNRQKNLPAATEQAAFSHLRKKAYLCRMDFARILTERYALSDEGTGLLMQSATLTQHARKEVIIEEGQRDGSITTEYGPELAELIPLLTSLWLAPTVYPATPEGMLRKFRVIGEMLSALGLPVIDEEMLRLAEDCFAKF